MTEPEIRFFKGPNDEKVAYAVSGQGPLVICPAWWVSHVEKDWSHKPFRDFFSRLGEGLSLVRYDRPGVGLSDRQPGHRSLDDEAALLGALARHLDAPSFSLFAISAGGPTAIRFAAANPNTVERICFYGSFAYGSDISPAETQKAMISIVGAHWGMGARAMTDIFMPDASREDFDQFTAQQRASTDVDTATQYLRLTYEMDARDALEQVAVDCLVLHRRADRAIPLEAGRKLAAGLPNARLVTLDGSAHPPWVAGDEISDLASRFLLRQAAPDQAAPDQASAEPSDTACHLDKPNRSLVIDGASTLLTPLEFGVLCELIDGAGTVVTRDHLLAAVWEQPFEGSNRIEAVIRTLRRKTGRFSGSIETVIGYGYRFQGWSDQKAR